MEQEIEKIMLRTFAGEASTEDIVNLSEWLALQEENKTTFQTVGAYWHASVSTTIPLHDKERTYEQLLKRVRASKRRLELTAWLRYAGVAAIVLVLTGAAYYYMSRADESIEQHYSLLTGASISSFQLPDGTDVTLNANSTLRYSDSFGERQRDVQLQGEAFFRVPKDINREFVVHLNEEMRIVVLGTTFNVRFDSTANNLSATLVEGSVRFETSDQAVVLTPNQQLLYNLADREISVITMEVEQAIAWKDRLLKYKSIPFSEAIALIEKQYKVEIQLADQTLGNQRISGTFDNDLSVEQILDIALTLDFSFDGRVGGKAYNRLEQAMWNSGTHIKTDNQWRYDEVVNEKTNYIGQGVKIVSGSAKYDTYGNILEDTRVFAPNDIPVSYEAYTKTYNPWNGSRRMQNVQDLTFFKLREVAIGYKLPVKSSGIENVQVSLVSQNLFIWAKEFKYSDPDAVYESYAETLNSPAMRYVGINIKVDF